MMLYLWSTTIWAITVTRFGRVVDAFSAVWKDGLTGRMALARAEELANMALQRRKSISDGKSLGSRVKGCDLSKGYPTLWEFLTKTAWGKDEPRETGTLFLMLQDGLLKASLSDRDSDEVLWIAGQSLSDVLGAAEAALNDPGADWRVDRKAIERRASQGQRRGVDRSKK